jgi:GT2 family glycosyltransferase
LAAIRAADNPPSEIIVTTGDELSGPAAARNAGVLRTEAEVLVFVDSDILVHHDAFSRIRRAFVDPQLTGVFGSLDDRPAAPGTVSRFRNLLHHHVHQSFPGPATTFAGGVGAIRRDAFLTAGGFDSLRQPTAMEDIELGMRLTAAGCRLILDPHLQGTHLKRWTLATMVHTDLLHRGIPWVRILVRRRTTSTALNLGWVNRVSALLALAAAGSTVRRRPSGTLTAALGLVALNRDFYSLLGRRLGRRAAVVCVGLHTIHLLTAVAAVPLGIGAEVLDAARRYPRRPA